MGGVEYTGAVDVWALGCIFAELLQRQVSSDLGALNKKLTVKPLFGFEDTKLASPPTGEHYDDEGCDESAEQRQAQLDTLFNVIGTPRGLKSSASSRRIGESTCAPCPDAPVIWTFSSSASTMQMR